MLDLYAAIKAKRAALQRLQEELLVLERALALLQGEEPSPEEVPSGPRVYGAKAKGYIGPDSQAGQAIAVLRDAGVPLHVSEIVKRIGQRGGKVSKTSLVGSISRLVKSNRVFLRTKPNVYGLVEWKPLTHALRLRRPENGGAGSAADASGGPDAVSKTTAGWPQQH